jgi:L-asparaginase
MAKPRIQVVGAGGTIAGKGPSATSAAYQSGRIGTDELLAAVDGLEQIADVHAETLFSTGSEDLGPSQWYELARRIQALADQSDVDGIVVTHGTDTLEEAALFLHLVCRTSKPVVITAAMRASTALSADGAANVHQAVLAATDKRLGACGVLAAMNGQLLHGSRIIKTNSVALETFSTYPSGPVGRLLGDQIMLFDMGRPAPLSGELQHLLSGPGGFANVGIAQLYGGCGDAPLRNWRAGAPDGMVIAGFGAGTMPSELARLAEQMAREGCVIVVSSRVGHVVVVPDTMTAGKDTALLASGVLNPGKSAILLALALADGRTAGEIGRLFDQMADVGT